MMQNKAGLFTKVSFEKRADGKNYQRVIKTPVAAILHPSLGAPLIRPSTISGDEPLSIFIVTDKVFEEQFHKVAGREGDVAGPELADLVHTHLKIKKWVDARSDVKDADEHLFADRDTAREHIVITRLGHLVAGGWKIWDKNSKVFGKIRSSAIATFLNGPYPLKYGFQIDITGGLKERLEQGLYDLAWVIKDHKHRKDPYLEAQDLKTINYIEEQFSEQLSKPYMLAKEQDDIDYGKFDSRHIQNYHPLYIVDKDALNLGHLSDIHVSSRQQVFTKSKAQMIQGASVGDSPEIGGLVNTSFKTLKNLMDQFGKSDIDLLVFTGDLIDYNRNFDPSSTPINKTGEIWEAMLVDHLKDPKKYPLSIDNVAMYSLFMYYMDRYKKPILLVSGNHEAYTVPYGISPRVQGKESTFATLDLTDKDIDTVVDKAVASRQKEWAARRKTNYKVNDERANEGIPADHNLTIPEAILMYGPDYNSVAMKTAKSGGSYTNFKKNNLEWFYTIFTPLSDFFITYKKQTIICLGWGDKESFVKYFGVKDKQGDRFYLTGFLPRAPESINDKQLEIVQNGLKAGGKDGINIVCSHFTFANYHLTVAQNEDGDINGNDVMGGYNHRDYGTFQQNRSHIYNWLGENKIHMTLSGHSHRYGLYQIKSHKDNFFGRVNLEVEAKSTVAEASKQGELNARDYQQIDQAKTKIIVSASGGPMACQNYDQELFQLGMERPSGTVITFNGASQDIKLVESTLETSKPRFAVALDYADIFHEHKKHEKGVFVKFTSGKNETKFEVEFNPELKLPKVDFIKKVELVAYQGSLPVRISIVLNALSGGKYSFNVADKEIVEVGEDAIDYLIDKVAEKDGHVLYCAISFKSALGNNSSHFKQYNYQSPWFFQVKIVANKDVIAQEYDDQLRYVAIGETNGYAVLNHLKRKEEAVGKAKGYTIYRHKKYGEVPDLKWRKKLFYNEYNFTRQM